jgi:hypothetical protein
VTASPAVRVERTHGGDPCEIAVIVQGPRRETRHAVIVCQADLEHLAGKGTSPERLVQAAFAFLLDREPNESILERFDVTVIGRYFDDFEREIGAYLARV